MATYIPGSASELDSLDSIKKVQEYLIKQERKLDYMFNNLAPEDNYSENARLIMVEDGERQASIEVSLNKIALNYVSKDGVVSAINLSEEMIQIEASKIKLEGLVTVNGYFKVGLDGSIEAHNGKFSGDISASTITGSHIIASNFGNTTDEFYIMATNSSRTVASMSGFTFEYNHFHSETAFDWENPAIQSPLINDGAGIGMCRSTGTAGFYVLYVNGVRHDISTEIDLLWRAIEGSGGGDGGSSSTGTGTGTGTNGEEEIPGEGTVTGNDPNYGGDP